MMMIPDRKMPEDDALEHAIGDLGKHCSDPAALLAWLQQGELLNQRCCCALMGLALCLDPYIGPSRCEIWMAILALCHPTGFPSARQIMVVAQGDRGGAEGLVGFH